MFYAIRFQINILGTSCHLYIPSILVPCFTYLSQSFNYLYTLGIICFCIFYIFFCKRNSFFHEIILYLTVRFNVNETEYEFIGISF